MKKYVVKEWGEYCYGIYELLSKDEKSGVWNCKGYAVSFGEDRNSLSICEVGDDEIAFEELPSLKGKTEEDFKNAEKIYKSTLTKVKARDKDANDTFLSIEHYEDNRCIQRIIRNAIDKMYKLCSIL